MRRAAREPPRAAQGRPGEQPSHPPPAHPPPPSHRPPGPPAHPPAPTHPPLPPPAHPQPAQHPSTDGPATRPHKNMGVSSLTRSAARDATMALDGVIHPLRPPYAPHPPPHHHHHHHHPQPPPQPPPPQNHAQQLELQRLRAQVEERDKEIAALRQAAKVKDRKLDQLANRCRKEQMRQYYRFMELEPVVEMEEDVCEESSSSSSGPPSLSPPPFGSDYWSEDSLYAGLAREHAELQRSHHALELRLKRSEARARAATERLQQLQAEAQELRELAELQEFRILELEGAGEHTAPARSPAPDTRDVCTDTENDDVSDSGVMSLPTSEDVASDSDLGVHDLKLELPPVPDLKEKILDAARALTNVEHKWTLHQAAALLDDARLALANASAHAAAHAAAAANMNNSLKSLPDYALNGDSSKFPARIVATVPPFTEMMQPTKLPLDSKSTAKQLNGALMKPNKIMSTLAANFCLRCSEELCTQGTQTDSDAVPSHGDLRAEIQKLNQFRERVEERGGDLAFCRERLNALEDKIRLYEKNGDKQESLLNEKKEKEVQLTSQVEQLTAKVAKLEEEKGTLEEQRCELEEAENDARLRCQKLELKLQLFSEENRDLQSKLLQERRVNTNLKNSMRDGDKLHREISYLQSVLGSYEERNFELEERETETKHHFDLLVSWWPVILVWNILRTAAALQKRPPLPLEYAQATPRREKRDVVPKTCNGLCRSSQERLVLRMKELERELKEKLSKDALASEKTDRETMTEEEARSPSRHDECCRQLRQALQAEAQLKHKVRDLEQKEKAYMETLQEADELWSELEGGYQRQVETLRASEAELRLRLEAAESAQRLAQRGRASSADAAEAAEAAEELEARAREATAAARRAEEAAAAAAARARHLEDALAAADAAAERAHRDADQLKQRLAQERRLREDLRGELQAKGEAMDAMQEALEDDISKLKSQISMLEKDNVQLSRECDEMKQGVDRLQSLLKEQEELMVKEKERNEKALANLSNALAEKERDLQRVMSLARDEDVRSAQEELEEAEASQIHKSTDIESDDETCSPQYSTFPRTSREKTVLPPIKPPRRAKKMDVKKAKEAMANKSYSLELISNTQGHVESGFKGRNRSLQDISHEGVTNDFLIPVQEKNERAPTPIPNPKREANSTKKAFIAYLPNSETNKCQMPSDNPCKPAIRGWRSQPESHRKPRWLTELSVRVNESSRNRPMSFPIKRSILYWDNINPKLQLKFSS